MVHVPSHSEQGRICRGGRLKPRGEMADPHHKLTVWRSGQRVGLSINKVNLRRAPLGLELRWVTVSGVQSPVPENRSQYITSHPG